MSSGSGVGLHEDEEWRNVSMSISEKGAVYDVNKLNTFSPNPKAIPIGDVVSIPPVLTTATFPLKSCKLRYSS